MPGLAAIIGTPKEDNARDLFEMVGSMRHEPFYTYGSYVNDEVGIYVGWTCLKGSYSDCLPVMNETKDLLLFFYGENFIDKSELEWLAARGHVLERPNASVLPHLFEEKGRHFFKSLNGWFHGLLVDLKRKEITLFNDRYGMQRLYYFEDKGAFLLASEAKAILKVRNELRSLDPQSIGEYLACDCVLQNRTLFSKLYTLPGGSAWSFKNAALDKKDCYFKPEEWEDQPLLNEDEFYASLAELFPNLISRYVQSSLPIAVSLSGGMDTRLIMAYIDHRNLRIPCYTFDGMYRESLDAKLARKVAAACGESCETLTLGNDFLISFPDLSERTVYLSDGCLGACNAYELYLNRMARKVADIRLTGNYGSEVLRSHRWFKAAEPNRNIIHSDFQKYVRDAMDTFNEIGKGHKLSFILFRQAPWYGYARLSVEQTQVIHRTPFTDNDFVGLMYRAPEAARSTTQLQWRLIEQGNPDLIAIPTDRGLRGHSGALSSKWAYFRSYFLSKADYLYKSGMPQWMEQMHYMLRCVQPERLIIGRHRFFHFRIWFRNELAAYVKEILMDRKSRERPYVDGNSVEAMVLRHIKGDRNYTSEIEKLLTIELIYRIFIDQ